MDENAPVFPEFTLVTTGQGTLQIVYQVTVGDLLICSMILLVLVFLILKAVISAVWRVRH